MEDRDVINMLLEGGNARYIDRETGEVAGFADKMDLKKLPRKTLVEEMIKVLTKLNDLFDKEYGEKLWKNFDVITSGEALNGSSSSLFNSEITDEEFVKHKPKVGDIDLTFPGEHMLNLWKLLNKIEKKKLGDLTTYLGHKNSNYKEESAAGQAQINAVFEIDTGDYKVNAQIDFEASEYEEQEDKETGKKKYAPTEWAKFSHSSSWADIKAGFKGVAHKFVLMNLARAQSRLLDTHKETGFAIITITAANQVAGMTKAQYSSGKPVKASTSQDYVDPTNLAFSIARGTREKFNKVLFKGSKEQLMVDDKPAFYDNIDIDKLDTKTKEPKYPNLLAQNTKEYTTSVKIQFQHIFGFEPTEADLTSFGSFVGIVELMKAGLEANPPRGVKPITQKVIENFFFDQLVTKTMFCANGCQGLERNNPEGDLAIKGAIINYLYDQFPFLKSYSARVDEEIEKYYKNYKMMVISEGFIPFGSKFSTIFEAVNNFNK